MGGTKAYLPSGGFKEQAFESVGTTANGIKILKRVNGRSSTPTFSNTPNTMYAKKDSNGRVDQISVYGQPENSRAKRKDIDIGHRHYNRDANGRKTTHFSIGDVHVHEYRMNSEGIPIRQQNARKPSRKERRLLMVARYGKEK